MSEGKKILKFSLTPQQVKIKEVINKDFLRITVRCISDVDPNNNGSHFNLEGMKKAVATGNLYNKPILGNWIKDENDFGGHDDSGLKYDAELDEYYYSYDDPGCEKPLGVIAESNRVEIVYDETEGVHWIEYDAVLWTKYSFKAIKKLLNSKRKKVSVEIECTDSYIRDDGIEEIVEFNYLGTTILSDKLGCGVPNAHLTILELMEDSLFQRKQKCLAFAYSALDEKMKNDNNVSAKTKKNKKVESAVTKTDENVTPNNVVETPTTENVEMDSNINDKFSSEGMNFEEKITIINENPNEEISMIQEARKGGSTTMTYEQKRALLEKWLCDNYRKVSDSASDDNEACECCCYVYVADLTDDLVYFSIDGAYYSAPYSVYIAESEDEESSVNVVLDEKVQVVRSWSNFANEAETVETETVETKTVETKTENVEEFAEKTDPIDPNEEPEDINTEKSTTDLVDEATASISAPKAIEGESIEEPTPMNEIQESAEGAAEDGLEGNSEPENGSVTEAVNEGPDGQKAEVVGDVVEETDVEQPDDDAKGEFSEENATEENATEENAADNAEENFAEDEDVCPECGKNPCICEKENEACSDKEEEACGDKQDEACDEKQDEACNKMEENCPECGQNPCVCEKQDEACDKMEETCDKQEEACDKQEEACDKMEEACGDNKEEMSVDTEEVLAENENNEPEKFEFDGEMLTMAEITEKFNAMKEKLNSYAEEERNRTIKGLIEFGENFVNEDDFVDEETKKEFIAKITTKCNENAFNSNDEVKEFAEEMMAMYYYKNRKNNEQEFSCPIEQPVSINEQPKKDEMAELKDSISKLNKVKK